MRFFYTIALLSCLVVGCGHPQKELWDKYDALLEHGCESDDAMALLEQIKKANPNSVRPNCFKDRNMTNPWTVQDLIDSSKEGRRQLNKMLREKQLRESEAAAQHAVPLPE